MLEKLSQAWKKAPNKGSLIFLVIVTIILFVFVMLWMWDPGFSTLVIWGVGTVDVGIWYKIALSVSTLLIFYALVRLFYRIAQRYCWVGHYGWGRLRRGWRKIPNKFSLIVPIALGALVGLFSTVTMLLWIWNPRFLTLFGVVEIGVGQRIALSLVAILAWFVVVYLFRYAIQRFGSFKKWLLQSRHWPRLSVLLAFIVFAIVIYLIWYLGKDNPSDSMIPNNSMSNSMIFGTRLTLTVSAIGALGISIVGILNLFANYRRANAAEKQQAQELFVDSIKNIENDTKSIRIGAIHGLGQLVKDAEDSWGPKVTEIFCDQIRTTTNRDDYSGDNPSDEIIAILKILTRGKDNPFDSTQFNLRKADLKGSDLFEANLSGANLREADLAKANLSMADLENTYLMGADLGGVDLNRANLRKANLRNVNLDEANLRRANLSEVNLRGSNLRKSNLSGINLSGAYLMGVNLRGSDLIGANLRKAVLLGSDLRESNLWVADLRESNLVQVNLSGVDLRRSDLRESNLFGANLIGADLSEVDLSGANLSGADLSRADLSGANLSEVNLTGANLTETVLTLANLKNSIRLAEDGNEWANFSGCRNYRGANLKNIYLGISTQSFSRRGLKDLYYGRENQIWYLMKNAVRRKPTQEEKERLVGKENVDKCKWGDILVLEKDDDWW